MGVQFTIQGGGQFSIRRFNIPWMKIDPGVNLPWGLKYHMTPGVFRCKRKMAAVKKITKIKIPQKVYNKLKRS